MKQTKYQIAVAIAITSICLSSCQRENIVQIPVVKEKVIASATLNALSGGEAGAGRVHLLTSQGTGNNVIA